MSQVFDRVCEYSYSTGTGAILLSGAQLGCRAFSSVLLNDATVDVVIENPVTGEWEISNCIYSTSSNSLTRDTLRDSSTGGFVSFIIGVKNVYIDATAFFLNNIIGGSGTVTLVTFTGDGTVLSSTPSSAVTTSGTVTASLNTTLPYHFLAGPTSGGAATPTFRAINSVDLPLAGTNSSNVGGVYTTAAGALTNSSGSIGVNVDGTIAVISSNQVTVAKAGTAAFGVVETPAAGALTNSSGSIGVNVDGTTIEINGSNQLQALMLSLNRTTVADMAATLSSTTDLLAYTSLTATRAVTIDPTTLTPNRIYRIKDESGDASNSVRITLTPNHSATIDGTSALSIASAYGCIAFYLNIASGNFFTLNSSEYISL